MRANALVPILAEKFGVISDSAFRIDRALAEAGLRAKGKGRNLPEMSRKEALSFLVACMVADKITKVADDVTPWLSALGTVKPFLEPGEEKEYFWGGDLDEEDESYRDYLAIDSLLSPHKNSDGSLVLINCLFELCAMIEKDHVTAEATSLLVSLNDLEATMSFGNLRVKFSVIAPTLNSNSIFSIEKPKRTTSIHRECSVGGITLKEIIDRT